MVNSGRLGLYSSDWTRNIVRMRTDIHRPAAFDPADYELRQPWDLRSPKPGLLLFPGITMEAARARWDEEYAAWRAERAEMKTEFGNGSVCDPTTLSGGRWPHNCDHCGQGNVRWVWSVLHKPSGEIICMGHECVDERLGITREAFRMKAIQNKATRDAAAALKAETLAKWRDANPVPANFLDTIDVATEKFDFLTDMISKLRQYGDLSPNQTSAVERIAAKRATQTAEAAERKATEVVPTTPAPEGRVTVTGKVVHTKTVESDFGSTMKMLVVLEDGNKVWTTIPSKLFSLDNEPIKGMTIKLTATFERSKDDEHFSFGKRPNAERVG